MVSSAYYMEIICFILISLHKFTIKNGVFIVIVWHKREPCPFYIFCWVHDLTVSHNSVLYAEFSSQESFCVIITAKPITSLNISQLVFIIDTDCVYSDVGTELLYTV
jgi:hypothetical protein